MRTIFILFIFFLTLKADFLGNFYMELQKIKLSREQQIQLNNAVRKHHSFLYKWYDDFNKVNNEIVDSFSNSSLSADSAILNRSIDLESQRVSAERNFLLNVYEILNKEQRAIFGEKIRERENYSRILQNRFENSQRLRQAENSGNPFEEIGK